MGAPKRLEEFRPIALLNCMLKIVSKILVNRLVSMLKYMIGDYQTRFILGRNITNGVAMAYEVIHQNRVGSRHKGYMQELDFKKAYDMVDWRCLFEVLEGRDFGSKLINWIRLWLTSAKVQVLVNGESGKEIVCKRGL